MPDVAVGATGGGAPLLSFEPRGLYWTGGVRSFLGLVMMPMPDLSDLLSLIGGGVVVKAIEWWKRRDELGAEQAAITIRKLFAQVELQAAEIREQQLEIRKLRMELDRCKDGHREAKSEADALRRDVADLREELDALKAALKGAGA